MADSIIRIGADWEQRLTVEDSEGTVDLTGFTGSCHLRVKGDYDTLAQDWSSFLAFEDDGLFISVSSSDTSELSEGDYWFDVILTDEQGIVYALPKIYVRCLRTVTRES